MPTTADGAIVLLSGGVDSAVALWWAKARGWDVRPLTFDYFGRPRREGSAIDDLAARAGVPAPRHIDLPFLKEVDDLRKGGLGNRALLEAPAAYIPARNLIFYSLAANLAETQGARYLVGGHNGVDPRAFPDASPAFFADLNGLLRRSLWASARTPVETVVPLSGRPKEDVVRLGLDLRVPFDVTWSCYWDRDVHCGTCASCRERRSAFAAVGVEDPVPYAGDSAEALEAAKA